MATVLLLWCVLVKCIQGFAQGPGHAEGRRFESISTREHWKLDGHVFKVLRSPSLLSCSQTCLTSWQCRSTNFEVVSATGEGICELNNECSTEEMAEDFTRQAGFVYTQYGERIVEEDCSVAGCVACISIHSCSGAMDTSGTYRERSLFSVFKFTTLGAKGRTGPERSAGYKGTSLEGKVHIREGLQQWAVPVSGLYNVEACGASGGDYATLGGKGAKVKGTIRLHKGTQLTLLIGQEGRSGGGGGGTFVVFPSNLAPLVVAGGGGGGGGVGNHNFSDGDPGQAGMNGSVHGGTGGTGGHWCSIDSDQKPPYKSGAGGGLHTRGGCFADTRQVCSQTACDMSGESFARGGLGGRGNSEQMDGGFGGGGGNDFCAGGGGGFSGGGVAYHFNLNKVHAGGGGSFSLCERWSVTTGGCEKGDGYVTITTDRKNP